MPKKVKLTLVGLNGNAFSLMGAFNNAARAQGWTKEEIQKVFDECMKGDYDHLLCTLSDVCVDVTDKEDEEEYDDDKDDLYPDEYADCDLRDVTDDIEEKEL